MIKALADEEDKFFQLTDPEKENLCLYGYPDGTWQLRMPSEEVPAELPEPTVGIISAKDGMECKEWLFLVANCSFSWLLTMAFSFAARLGFRTMRVQAFIFFQFEEKEREIMEVMRGKHGVGDVFDDFKGRRVALIKAPTDEADEFSGKCSPERENLCLYGFPNGTWEVKMPIDEVPPELPEPTVGINYARNGSDRKEWISIVAVHADCWLKAVAFYFGARFGFDKNERAKLFQMINNLPTVSEVVKMEPEERSSIANCGKSLSSKKMSHTSKQHKSMKRLIEVKKRGQQEGDDAVQGESLCGACGNDYADDYTEEFWIFCDTCERWFHGKCVKITPEIAAHIDKYTCRNCASNKRAKV